MDILCIRKVIIYIILEIIIQSTKKFNSNIIFTYTHMGFICPFKAQFLDTPFKG